VRLKSREKKEEKRIHEKLYNIIKAAIKQVEHMPLGPERVTAFVGAFTKLVNEVVEAEG